MHKMVFAVVDEMQAAYPELKETAERVSKVVLRKSISSRECYCSEIAS